jgi:hypothetical protein
VRKGIIALSASAPVVTVLLCFIASGCKQEPKIAERETQQQTASPGVSSPAASNIDMFDLRAHPDAIVMKPLDPATLTKSQRQFGIAPRLDPRVEYRSDIILMEQGDQAIRSIASNGIIWTFDANAPHVNEFAMGKIVFATGRAVGRIAMLKREGDSVQVILLPVQLNDLIAKGSFAMDSDIDIEKMTPFVYPDFPEPRDEGDETAGLPTPGVDHWKGSIVVSRVSRSGKWTPVNMTTVSAEGHRERFQRIGGSWAPEPVFLAAPIPTSRQDPRPPRLIRSYYQRPFSMPGVPGPQISLPKLPDFHPPTIPVLPPVDLQGLIPNLIANGSGIGVQYTYDKSGIHVVATGMLNFSGMHARTFFTSSGGVIPKDCGIELQGVVGVTLHLKAHTDIDRRVNIRKRGYLPISMWIPIGGPVPFAITFDQGLVLNTGFSAKSSVLNAEGLYAVHGKLKAGYINGRWAANPGLTVESKTDIGNTTEGISVGIGSLLMGADLRVMLGLGAGPFNFGVYAMLVYTGTILRAPDEGRPCRQGTIDVVLKSGLGYSLPQFVADAVNYLLSIFTDARIEAKGTVLNGPEQPLLNDITRIPAGCSGGG